MRLRGVIVQHRLFFFVMLLDTFISRSNRLDFGSSCLRVICHSTLVTIFYPKSFNRDDAEIELQMEETVTARIYEP